MIRPMPFWPSFEPWKKLTSVQVRIRMPRIHIGGPSWPFGSENNCSFILPEITNFNASSRTAASTKPKSGESKSALPIEVAWVQSTPEVPLRPCSNALATPTPITDPIRVWELDAGRPNDHVPRFQMIAAIRSANTMAKPAPDPTCKISSTGSNDTMPNATAPDDHSTPNRLKMPDHTTAMFAGSERV